MTWLFFHLARCQHLQPSIIIQFIFLLYFFLGWVSNITFRKIAIQIRLSIWDNWKKFFHSRKVSRAFCRVDDKLEGEKFRNFNDLFSTLSNWFLFYVSYFLEKKIAGVENNVKKDIRGRDWSCRVSLLLLFEYFEIIDLTNSSEARDLF